MTELKHQEIINTHFDRAAGFWDEIYQQQDVYAVIHQDRRRIVLEMVESLALAPDARVLEIGCGAGYVAVELARRGCLVTAIDGAPAMVAATRERARQAGVAERVGTAGGDIHALTYPDGAFDLVLAIGVMPWLDAVEQPLAEMRRVTRPGGAVIVTMDHRWGLNRMLDPRIHPLLMPLKRAANRLLARAGAIAPKAESRTLSIPGFDARLRRTGLKKIRGVSTGYGPFTFFNVQLFSNQRGVAIHRRLAEWAGRGAPLVHAVGSQYVVLAKRPTHA